MDNELRATLKRIKGRRRRVRQADVGATLREIERMLARIELAIEVRGTVEQWQQALTDILNIYSLAGQSTSVIKGQHEQIQALVDAYGRLSRSLKEHHDASTTDRQEIKDLLTSLDLLLVPLRELAHKQVAQLDNIERAMGMSQAERAKLRTAKKDGDG